MSRSSSSSSYCSSSVTEKGEIEVDLEIPTIPYHVEHVRRMSSSNEDICDVTHCVVECTGKILDLKFLETSLKLAWSMYKYIDNIHLPTFLHPFLAFRPFLCEFEIEHGKMLGGGVYTLYNLVKVISLYYTRFQNITFYFFKKRCLVKILFIFLTNEIFQEKVSIMLFYNNCARTCTIIFQ